MLAQRPLHDLIGRWVYGHEAVAAGSLCLRPGELLEGVQLQEGFPDQGSGRSYTTCPVQQTGHGSGVVARNGVLLPLLVHLMEREYAGILSGHRGLLEHVQQPRGILWDRAFFF